MELSPQWEYVSDQVMGGVSSGALSIDGPEAAQIAHLTGRVSLENNGGFVQMAFDVGPGGAALDASEWRGIALDLRGNGQAYDVRLRTTQLTRPWQSFRTQITAPKNWETLELPFDRFIPHRTDATFDASMLRRVGILAIGRVFDVDVCVAKVRLYR